MQNLFKKFEALFIHEQGTRTSLSVDYSEDAISLFKQSKTAISLFIYKSSHNGTRLKLFSSYHKEEFHQEF